MDRHADTQTDMHIHIFLHKKVQTGSFGFPINVSYESICPLWGKSNLKQERLKK